MTAAAGFFQGLLARRRIARHVEHVPIADNHFVASLVRRGSTLWRAPAGDDPLFHGDGFGGGDGLVDALEFGDHYVEFLGALAFEQHGLAGAEAVAESVAEGYFASFGCFRAAEFFPLARAVSDLSLLGMALFSPPVYMAVWDWQGGGFCRLLKLGGIYL